MPFWGQGLVRTRQSGVRMFWEAITSSMFFSASGTSSVDSSRLALVHSCPARPA